MIPDQAGDTALEAESDHLLRIVSGKDHRTIGEMFRDSKRARRRVSKLDGKQGANELPQLLDHAGRSQGKRNKLPWNVWARSVSLLSPFLKDSQRLRTKGRRLDGKAENH